MTLAGDKPPPVMEEIELTPLGSQGVLAAYSGKAPAGPPKPFWRRYHDLPLLVGIPAAVAVVYLFFIAANQYTSETRFVVRSNAGSSISGVTSLIQNQGLSRAADETYVVGEYVKSRDIVALLEKNDNLREIMSRPEGDFISRFPNFYSKDNFEQLYKHYQRSVQVTLDEGTGISTLRAFAYRAEDAHALVAALMRHAEALINRLNDRAHDDAARYAGLIVDKARAKAADVQARLTIFRNANGTIDPSKESSASLEMIGRMNSELAQFEATLSQQIALTPSSPSIAPLRQRIKSYSSEIDKLRSQVVGAEKSTASHLAGYEALTLERDLAAKSLEGAVINLEKAQQEAQQKHMYLETISEPDLAETPEYPRRFLDLGIVLAVSLGVWSIVRSLRLSAMEHAA